MYAVVETGGQKYTVEEGHLLRVPRLDGSAGDKVTIEKVLLISDGNEPLIGKPYVENATVEAELMTQVKDAKILIYKYKRRTKSRRTRGHRQQYTELKITKIHAPR